jgi:hypothetical protein
MYNVKMSDIFIPKTLTCESVREATVVNCEKCDGVGSLELTIEKDYHKRLFEIGRVTCDICEGDGRMILIQEHFKIVSLPDRSSDRSSLMIPYRGNAYTKIDPFLKESCYVAYKIDRRDYNLENKHPDLKSLTYENYDKLSDQYRLVEILKK